MGVFVYDSSQSEYNIMKLIKFCMILPLALAAPLPENDSFESLINSLFELSVNVGGQLANAAGQGVDQAQNLLNGKSFNSKKILDAADEVKKTISNGVNNVVGSEDLQDVVAQSYKHGKDFTAEIMDQVNKDQGDFTQILADSGSKYMEGMNTMDFNDGS